MRATLGERGVLRVGLDDAGLGDRLPGEDAAVDDQPIDPDEAQVRRDDVAAAEEDDVTRHDGRRGHVVDDAAPPDAGHRRARLAQRLEGALPAIPRHDVRDDDRQETRQDEEPVADLAEQDRGAARDEQEQHERLRGGVHDHPQHGLVLDRLKLVPAALGSAALDLVEGESDSRVDPEERLDRLGGARVRRGLHGPHHRPPPPGARQPSGPS